MSNNLLNLFCLVDGEAATNAFPVEIESTKTIGDLKKFIWNENAVEFTDVDAKSLTLWRVSIPITKDNEDTPILLEDVPSSDKNKLGPTDDVPEWFQQVPLKKTIHVIVQRPPPVAKRDREEDAGPSSTRKRHRPHTLMDAIEEAGLTEKAVVDGRSNLSRLDNKQKVTLLGFIGEKVDETDKFYSLSSTAQKLRRAIIKDKGKLLVPPDTKPPVVGTNEKDSYDLLSTGASKSKAEIETEGVLSAPSGTQLPIVNTKELYVRKAYKDLYKTITDTFNNDRNEAQKHVVVTGTSGIGKSAFLVYLAIRLLAESDDDNPPIIIFHTKRSSECYVFGGRSTVRSGAIEDFKPFLSLPDTWYFVDSSPDPILDQAKTVISASPKTLFSEAQQYQDVDKRVEWRYYMAPWTLEELTACRASVVKFQVVPLEAVEDLYLKIGGVPRYVLEMPMTALDRRPNDLQHAKTKALDRLVKALHKVSDPVTLMQFFSQGRDTLEFSSRLIHRWPTDDHEDFRLEWASTYVAGEVAKLLTQDSCTQMLKTLIKDPNGSASGIMFEAYVLRTFREGGHTFELKDLETGESARLEIPRSPKIVHFDKITQTLPGTLFIPKVCNYACVDLLLAPRDLFQITVSKNHPIKGPPLKNLITNLREASWIPPDDLRLIFVVPSRVYADFKKQGYLASGGKAYVDIPQEFEHVKQYALKIDMESAVAGGSPGLQTPLQ